jgi:hypothetical protein
MVEDVTVIPARRDEDATHSVTQAWLVRRVPTHFLSSTSFGGLSGPPDTGRGLSFCGSR